MPGDHSSARAQEGNKFLIRRPLYGTKRYQSASVVRGQAVGRVGRGFVGVWLVVCIRKNTKIETQVESGSHKVRECTEPEQAGPPKPTTLHAMWAFKLND